jgi:hypothetical protein
MSALPLKADLLSIGTDVCYVPLADMRLLAGRPMMPQYRQRLLRRLPCLGLRAKIRSMPQHAPKYSTYSGDLAQFFIRPIRCIPYGDQALGGDRIQYSPRVRTLA